MPKPIGLTTQELLTMRENGMSNHDIAKSLDISYATVLRYIGKQGGKMDSLEAFKDTPAKVKEEPKKAEIPPYEPKPIIERYKIGEYDIELDGEDREITICGEDIICIPYDHVPEIVQFLAWAMRERMEG